MIIPAVLLEISSAESTRNEPVPLKRAAPVKLTPPVSVVRIDHPESDDCVKPFTSRFAISELTSVFTNLSIFETIQDSVRATG